ncbi:MAG: 5-(carboxyamino)imidazole ribonucleotide synthase [Gemmatimonadaceae bacterium]|nr:5-(carboxyamino)imidazole ribonucleotide synthase [Gemmatimonadaceae bacterium]
MRVGVLGGGQLGRMLALAGYRLGIQFRFFDPNSGAPVGQLGELIAAPYDDEAALARFCDGLDVATYEFENVPLDAARFVAERVKLYPPIQSLEVAQHRLKEKEFFSSLGIPTPKYAPANSADELAHALGVTGIPAVVKTVTMGYDGKGQVVVRDRSAAASAWDAVGKRAVIVEEMVAFDRELSMIGARDNDGREVYYPLIENEHSDGILRVSRAPVHDVSLQLRGAAEDYVRRIFEKLDYIGVLAVEFFQRGSELLVNEMAPRVHNSGHWTIEGARTSQFENHLRAILSLPMGEADAIGEAAMVNLIGETPPLQELLSIPGAHVHLYGKAATERRKVGHITLVGESARNVGTLAETLRRAFGTGTR